jgi:DNA topoisomerase-3
MSKILVIAEKPSMGRDIADALSAKLGVPVRNGGLCQHVGQYTVVGAQGHLFSLVYPEEYGTQFAFPWRVGVLPVLPETFLLEPNYERKNGKVVDSSLTQSIRTRLGKIAELIATADEVIHAGDPDREGQLIIDDILRHFDFRGGVRRLWLHAQTRDGILDALQKMKDNATYTNLGIAAVARRESDWAIGMNATRAYSAVWWQKGHKGVLNVGRVVTPVVGMIVQREKDIENFVPINHYTLRAHVHIGANDPFIATWVKPNGEGRPEFDVSGKLVIDRAFVQAIQAKCEGKPAKIITADKTPKSEKPPLLFSLVELQKMAARMGYSPDEVLAAAQALYEKHKLTSYPRTECQYAPESEHLKAGDVIKSISSNFASVWPIPAGWDAKRKSEAWNDAKLAEHFAIIPLTTSCPVGGLSKIEKDVYRLICRQYLAQFFPRFEFLATTLVVQVEGETFKATGKTPTVEGWRCLFGGASAVAKKTGPDSDEQDCLPGVSLGQTGRAKPIDLEANKTQPPKRFTAITLLEAMEKAYLFVTDPKVKAKLKQVEGIGTAATRATIIARTVSTGLAAEDRTGKVISYMPTPKAFGYIACLSQTLTKPDLTAWFEGKLDDLSKGALKYIDYRIMLAKLVDHVITAAKNGTALQNMPRPEDMPAQVAAKKPRKSAPRKTAGAKRAKTA